MKKKICDLKQGTPFKHKGQVFIVDDLYAPIRLTDGAYVDQHSMDVFKDGDKTLVTVCRRIKKSDIKERK